MFVSSKNLAQTRLPPALHHKAQFAYQWLLPPARGGVPRPAGRLGVPAFQEPSRTGWSAGGPGEARAVARVVGPHGTSRAAPMAGVPREAARWGLSWRGRAWRGAGLLRSRGAWRQVTAATRRPRIPAGPPPRPPPAPRGSPAARDTAPTRRARAGHCAADRRGPS